jgi:hypothetical protein
MGIDSEFIMARSNQALTEDQPDMFGPEPASVYQPNLDKVRARLHKILAEARSAGALSWEPSTLSLYRTIFPQMALFLPEPEGAQLRQQFEAELARLDPPASA